MDVGTIMPEKRAVDAILSAVMGARNRLLAVPKQLVVGPYYYHDIVAVHSAKWGL